MAGFVLHRLRKFLFCCSLRFGALFIGYLSMVTAIAYLALTSFYIYFVAWYVQQNKDGILHDRSPENIDSNALRLYIIYGLQLFIFMFYLIFSLLLVIGTHKRQTNYMKYYYRAGFFTLFMNLVVIFVSVALYGYVTLVNHLLMSVILVYFLVVVRSAFMEMEEEQARPRDYEKKLYDPAQPTPQPVYT